MSSGLVLRSALCPRKTLEFGKAVEMSTTVEKFEQWCVVEIMGHKKFAGFVSEQSIGGTSFVRVDVPDVEAGGRKLPAFSKLFGASSIYCLSPCTEETARAFAAQIRSESFNLYEAPRLPAPAIRPEEEPIVDDLNECVDCGCDIPCGRTICADCEFENAND